MFLPAPGHSGPGGTLAPGHCGPGGGRTARDLHIQVPGVRAG
jgi:hypothetical protein